MNPRAVKTVLLLSSGMTVMSGAIIAPALPEISRYFADDAPEVLRKLVLTMPALTIALSAPVAGHLSDLFGRKTLLVLSLVLYGIAGFSGFFLDDLSLLLFSRAVLGLAVGGIMSATTALIGDCFTGSERSRFMGLQSSFMYVGGVVLLLLGGGLAAVSWRGPFLCYLTAFIVAPMAVVWIAGPVRSARARRQHEADPAERLPMSVMATVCFLVFLLMVFYYMIPVQVPFVLQERFGAGSAMTGGGIAFAAFTGALASFCYPLFRRAMHYRTIYAAGFAVVAAGYVVVGNAVNWPVMLAGLAIGGFGSGMLMPNGSLWLLESVPESFRGRAVGFYTAMIFLGQFLSPVLTAPFVSLFSLSGAFLVSAALLGALACCIVLLPFGRAASSS
ncbi:MFS transporter [Prosthecochloris sp. GSB1]|uniref:MFS transporter n=1 Tax=Prosthecochloris sp. GSB1 TaxID=281093 RepID=UPI001C2CB5F3|nr:MFS transporter [Prosthecochloris sp. GSB1]